MACVNSSNERLMLSAIDIISNLEPSLFRQKFDLTATDSQLVPFWNYYPLLPHQSGFGLALLMITVVPCAFSCYQSNAQLGLISLSVFNL